MTREEFMEDNKYHINIYGKYYVNIMKKKYPNLIFSYKTAPKSRYVVGVSYDTIKDKYLSFSYARRHNIPIFDDVVGFYCIPRFGCVPLFKRID